MTTKSSTIDKIRVARIRPVSWKIFVQGREEANYVRELLRGVRIETSDPEQAPGLTDPPLWSFDATSAADAPTIAEELVAILKQDPRVQVDI